MRNLSHLPAEIPKCLPGGTEIGLSSLSVGLTPWRNEGYVLRPYGCGPYGGQPVLYVGEEGGTPQGEARPSPLHVCSFLRPFVVQARRQPPALFRCVRLAGRQVDE